MVIFHSYVSHYQRVADLLKIQALKPILSQENPQFPRICLMVETMVFGSVFP